MNNRHLTMLCLSLTIILLIATSSFGLMVMSEGGSWPRNWPASLEPFRTRAATGHFMAGSQATYYYIEFETRNEFESVWPSLLKLKSKGAPLTLHTVDPYSTDPNDKRVLYTKPQVVIVCPASGYYREMPDGQYGHLAKWSKDIEPMLNGGVPPQFVGKDSTDRWRTDPNKYSSEILQQARIELTLYIDGNVIDLNRIRLPQSTLINDYRKLED